MPTPTPSDAGEVPKNPHPVQSPEWIYDEIMRHIEPELMLQSIPTLEERFRGESDEEFRARMRKYDTAYRVFDAAEHDVIAMLAEQTKQLRNRAKRQSLRAEYEDTVGERTAAERNLDFPSAA